MNEWTTRAGVLSFDGRVVERFGFGHTQGDRIHVEQILEAEFVDNRMSTHVSIEGTGASRVYARITFDLSDAERASLEDWLAAVRAAAPNLRE